MGGYVSPGMGPRRAMTITDLILRRGDVAAQQAAGSGQIWGNALANLGQTIGGAFQQHQEQKQFDKRTEALTQLASSPVWTEDPQAGMAAAVKVLGPQEGVKFARGIMATAQVAEKPDPSVAQKNLPIIAQGWMAATPEARQQLWTPLRQTMLQAQLGTEEDWPPEWSEEMAPQVEAIAQQFNPEDDNAPENFTLGPGQSRYTPEGEVIAEQPFKATAPEPTLEDKVREKEALTRAAERVRAEYAKQEESASEKKNASKFATAIPIINAVSELSERINTLQGVAAKASGEIERKKAQMNLNDDVAEYEALIMGFTPLVARALGHTGVLTEQDVQSTRMLFPRPGDSKSLRNRKMARLKSIVASMPGVDPSALGDIVQPQVKIKSIRKKGE